MGFIGFIGFIGFMGFRDWGLGEITMHCIGHTKCFEFNASRLPVRGPQPYKP